MEIFFFKVFIIMRFVIGEHKLDRVIFKFIHDYIMDTFTRSRFDNFIVYSKPDETDFGYDDVKIEHDSEDGRLYIDRGFLMLISNMFGLNLGEAQLKIYDWFKWYEDADTKYLDTPGYRTHYIE